ncbi:MAG: preprotein translocase subunit YajC [Dehalococcoidales bacterium]|jgi:preprotein translocase subunit YajC
MNNIWKIGLIAGLLIAVLILSGGCLATTPASVTSANATTTGGEQSAFEGIWPMLVFLVVIFAMFYFLMIRPQRKRQKAQETMMQGLQKGDRVVTAGGIYGTIESVSDDSVVIKVESGTTLRVNKGSVALRRDETRK